MRTFCITIMDLPQSLEAARRCQESGKAFGVSVDLWSATTPSDEPERSFEALGWPTEKFFNKWNRPEAAMAAFLSHSSLWRACSVDDENFLILEHDAVFTGEAPRFGEVGKLLCNVGKPSFGRFKEPEKDGWQPFFSNPAPKGYLKGAHGYIISPSGAREMLQRCVEAEPTDTFLNLQRFPWMTEYTYKGKWPIECWDAISTIQEEAGCRAKHRDVHPV